MSVRVCKDEHGNFPPEVPLGPGAGVGPGVGAGVGPGSGNPDVELVESDPRVGIRTGAGEEDPDRIVFG